MSYRNRTPRMAALLLSVALGGASLTMLPPADAAPQVHVPRPDLSRFDQFPGGSAAEEPVSVPFT